MTRTVVETFTLAGVRHLTSDAAYAEVRECESQRREVSDECAATIASWWQSSGTVGSAFAALASGAPTDRTALLQDISLTLRDDSPEPRDVTALGMLATWALNYGDDTSDEV